MKDNHTLIILGLCAGVILGILSAHFMWEDRMQKPLHEKWRCVEYIGNKSIENCVLIRKEQL